MTIRGDYFDGVTSRRFAAELEVDATGTVSLVLPEAPFEPVPEPAALEHLAISSRLHDVPRSIRFAGGQQFMTSDNQAVDRMLESAGLAEVSTLAHRLESHVPVVVTSWLGVVACVAAFLFWGVPAIADRLAKLVPESVEIDIGKRMMEEIDRGRICVDSELDMARRWRIEEYLDAHAGSGIAEVEFRKCPILGANAFALPGGIILLTDGLVDLAEEREQILAVYFHEMGHVMERHLVRQGLQSSLVGMLLMAITGDLTAATDLVATVPATLLTFRYSRDFERAADAYAIRRLKEENIDPDALAEILRRLEDSKRSRDRGMNGMRYLATHPGTEERLETIEQARSATP